MTRDGTVGRSDATERNLPVHRDIDPARVMSSSRLFVARLPRWVRTAQRTQRVPLCGGQSCHRKFAGGWRPLEEWVRPSPSAYPPSKHHANCPHHQPWIEPRRALWRAAHRVLAVDAPNGRAEQVIGSLRLAFKYLRDDAYERDRRTDRIANRRPTAACVPSIQALGAEAQPDDSFLALTE